MNTGAKLGLFGLLLATSLGLGAALGAVVGPIEVGGDAADHQVERPEQPDDRHDPTGHGDG